MKPKPIRRETSCIIGGLSQYRCLPFNYPIHTYPIVYACMCIVMTAFVASAFIQTMWHSQASRCAVGERPVSNTAPPLWRGPHLVPRSQPTGLALSLSSTAAVVFPNGSSLHVGFNRRQTPAKTQFYWRYKWRSPALRLTTKQLESILYGTVDSTCDKLAMKY